MVKKRTLAIAGGLGAVAGIIGIAAVANAQSKVTTPPPPVSNYTITLSTSTPSASAGSTVVYTVSLTNNGVAVPGTSVSLTDITTGVSSSTNTNSSGIATFDVVFPSAGTFELQASASV